MSESHGPADGERVSIEIDQHVAVVTLTRAEKHNALDLPMLDAIIAAAERLRGERGVRVVVLHGAGKSFCSGLDFPAVAAAGGLEAFTGILDQPSPNYFQQAGHGWIDLPVPVIAAIHGSCLGGGLQIALAADIRIAARDARLSIMETRWGLIPDMSITRTLPRLVGIDAAKELTFTARTISAEDGHRLGLVTHLADDPLAAAMELAREVAQRSPDAVRSAKRLFNDGWSGDAEQTLALEARLQGELIGTANQIAAMTAAMTKQEPLFTDP